MSLGGVLTRKGAPVTFTHSTPGTYDPATDTSSAAVAVEVSGKAMQVANDPLVFQALELVLSDHRSLLFEPSVPGTLPAVGSLVVWDGVTLSVLRIPDRMAMSGLDKAALIIVGAG